MIGHIKFGQYLKNIARAISKKYCPPCHKARGIHNFILATKSPVWIIMYNTAKSQSAYNLQFSLKLNFLQRYFQYTGNITAEYLKQ